jgi:hypothetical protein
MIRQVPLTVPIKTHTRETTIERPPKFPNSTVNVACNWLKQEIGRVNFTRSCKTATKSRLSGSLSRMSWLGQENGPDKWSPIFTRCSLSLYGFELCSRTTFEPELSVIPMHGVETENFENAPKINLHSMRTSRNACESRSCIPSKSRAETPWGNNITPHCKSAYSSTKLQSAEKQKLPPTESRQRFNRPWKNTSSYISKALIASRTFRMRRSRSCVLQSPANASIVL